MREHTLTGAVQIIPCDDEEGKQITVIAGPNDVTHIKMNAELIVAVIDELQMTNEDLAAKLIADRTKAEKEAKEQALGAMIAAGTGDIPADLIVPRT